MPLVALLDTNVWVSAFLKPTGPPGQVVSAWARDGFNAVTSSSQLIEISEVLGRPRLIDRFKYSNDDAEMFARLIAARATIVQTTGELKICRDPDDDEILEAAIVGKAWYLVTRDDDLNATLTLSKWRKVRSKGGIRKTVSSSGLAPETALRRKNMISVNLSFIVFQVRVCCFVAIQNQ